MTKALTLMRELNEKEQVALTAVRERIQRLIEELQAAELTDNDAVQELECVLYDAECDLRPFRERLNEVDIDREDRLIPLMKRERVPKNLWPTKRLGRH